MIDNERSDAGPHTLPSRTEGASDPDESVAADEQRIEEAVALWLATKEFSPSVCDDAALENLDEVLNMAAEIERNEAKRLLNKRDRKNEYKRLAKHAAGKSGLNASNIVFILCQADEWPFRVLKAAKEIQKKRKAK